MDLKTFILLACIATFASGTKYEICRNDNPDSEIIDLDFDGCPDSDDPCRVEWGSSKEITITFKSLTDASEVTTYVQVMYTEYMADQVKKYEANGCAEGSGLTCPLEKDQTYTYKGTVEFNPSYGKRDEQWLKWELYKGKNIVCVEIKVELYEEK